MKIIEGYTVTDDTNYWIYPINIEIYKTLKEHYENTDIDHYIPLWQNYGINSFDIIFYWVLGKKNKNNLLGFNAICQVYNKPVKNDKLIITKDINIQRFIIECDSVELFTSEVDKSDFESKIKETNNEFKSYLSFVRTYVKKEGSLNKLPQNMGENILKYLSKHNEKKEKIIIENIETKENKKEVLFSQIRKKKVVKEINIFDESLDNTPDSDLDDSSELESDSDSESNNKPEPEDPEHKDGYIPIMVVPCKPFKFPCIECNEDDMDEYGNTEDSRAKCEYFINHINKCKNCEITNNNSLELNILLKDCIYSFLECKESSADMTLIFEHYFNVKKCNLFGDTIEKTTVKIVFINDKYTHYHNSIFVCIADPASEEPDIAAQSSDQESNSDNSENNNEYSDSE